MVSEGQRGQRPALLQPGEGEGEERHHHRDGDEGVGERSRAVVEQEQGVRHGVEQGEAVAQEDRLPHEKDQGQPLPGQGERQPGLGRLQLHRRPRSRPSTATAAGWSEFLPPTWRNSRTSVSGEAKMWSMSSVGRPSTLRARSRQSSSSAVVMAYCSLPLVEVEVAHEDDRALCRDSTEDVALLGDGTVVPEVGDEHAIVRPADADPGLDHGSLFILAPEVERPGVLDGVARQQGDAEGARYGLGAVVGMVAQPVGQVPHRHRSCLPLILAVSDSCRPMMSGRSWRSTSSWPSRVRPARHVDAGLYIARQDLDGGRPRDCPDALPDSPTAAPATAPANKAATARRQARRAAPPQRGAGRSAPPRVSRGARARCRPGRRRGRRGGSDP